MIKINGSFGEGGGQILRTSLALSMLTGQKFKIENIRAKRKKPGLLRQHLTAVKAAGDVCQANISGNALHSQVLQFSPGKVSSGNYHFKVGTAGSTTLILQTILPALMKANGESEVQIEGGTHNPYAPPFDFIDLVFAPIINQMGPELSLTLDKIGFFPAGGGKISARILPAQSIRTIELMEKGDLVNTSVRSVSSQIPAAIGVEEINQIKHRLNLSDEDCLAEMVESSGPGNIVMIKRHYQNITELFTGFGQIRVSHKRVVNRAVGTCNIYEEADVPVGEFLADQLLIPMAIAGAGRVKTLKPSNHTITNIEVIKKFLDVKINTYQLNELQWLIEVGG